MKNLLQPDIAARPVAAVARRPIDREAFMVQMFKFALVLMAMVVGFAVFSSAARAAEPVTDPDAQKAIDKLRTALVESFNKGDMDGMLSHLDADAVVTWQNGEVCVGPKEVRAYCDRMLSGPNKVVAKVSAEPKVTGRHMQGDWAVSWGDMNDKFTMADGKEMAFNSRFTATIAKRGEVWKIVAIHLSLNAFNNPILGEVASKTAMWTAIATVVPLLAIILLLVVLKRKKGSQTGAAA